MRKFLAFMVVAATVFAVSCSDDDNSDETTDTTDTTGTVDTTETVVTVPTVITGDAESLMFGYADTTALVLVLDTGLVDLPAIADVTVEVMNGSTVLADLTIESIEFAKDDDDADMDSIIVIQMADAFASGDNVSLTFGPLELVSEELLELTDTEVVSSLVNPSGDMESVFVGEDLVLNIYPMGPLGGLFNDDGVDGKFYVEDEGESWEITNSAGGGFGAVVVTYDGTTTADASSGDTNLRITNTSAEAGEFGYLKDAVAADQARLMVGETYKVSFMAKVKSRGSYDDPLGGGITEAFMLVFGVGTNGWADLNPSPILLSGLTLDTWEEVTFEFTVASAAPGNFMALRLRGEGDVLIDDFFVEGVSTRD